MVTSVSNSNLYPTTSSHLEISPESNAGWQGQLSLKEAAALLENYSSFTFILSKLKEEVGYLLSFVNADQIVCHVHFSKNERKNMWCYKNGQENEFPSLDEMIKKAMHCNDSPTPLHK
jgi:hypothetical protein